MTTPKTETAWYEEGTIAERITSGWIANDSALYPMNPMVEQLLEAYDRLKAENEELRKQVFISGMAVLGQCMENDIDAVGDAHEEAVSNFIRTNKKPVTL